MSSLALCVIAPRKSDAKRLVDEYGAYFDAVYIQEAPNCTDFADARNKCLKKVKTDYWFWCDTDDTIKNPEKLKDLVKLADEDKLDAIYLPYEYGYNEEGELIALHWRERLIRTSHPFKWVGKVHETLDSQEFPLRVKNEEVIIKHAHHTLEETMASLGRNHRIMEKAVKDGDEDPRLLYYLGRSYFHLGDYDQSAQLLLKYTEVSGWDEQRYDAWMKIGDCMILLDEYEKAINSCFEAMKLIPSAPDAYLKIGDIYLEINQPQKAAVWLEKGIKLPPPETLEILDPTMYTSRPMISLAMAYFKQAKVELAYQYIKKAAQFKPKNKTFRTLWNVINKARNEENAVKSALQLGQFVNDKGSLKKYIDGLPGFIRNDLRLRSLRVKAYPPKKWADDTITIYCGENWDEWGPDTLSKGMGGSEEAVVYLSRELSKLGYEITVYNQRVDDYVDGSVTYKPWETFNPEDEFNIFIAWRNPMFAPSLEIKAKLKAVDMHDCPVGYQHVSKKSIEYNDLFFFKSEYQRDMSSVPKEKCLVINNGIVPEQFKVDWKKRQPHKVIFASSADRGLDTLLEVWPKVKKEIPDAELVWAYGWNSYDTIHKENDEKRRWKWQIILKMRQLGVKELGRLSHEDLAKEMASCSVWAYPTSFEEIDCITAKKAQAAGCQPITSGRAALQETLLVKEPEVVDIHLKPEELRDYTDRLIKALKSPLPDKKRLELSNQAIAKWDWAKVALRWKEALSES